MVLPETVWAAAVVLLKTIPPADTVFVAELFALAMVRSRTVFPVMELCPPET